MRQVFAFVKKGEGEKALKIATQIGDSNVACMEVRGPDGDQDLLLIESSNDNLDELVNKLQELNDLRISFSPAGVISLRPPANKAPEQATDVSLRSPLEVFLSGLQSIGSWKGFLGYAIAAGIVVWTGLYTGTVYLLVAAMLIAPFAGPAITLALGTARGDQGLIVSSCFRYFVSLSVCILTTAGLSLLMGQEIATELMVSTTEISSVHSILAITAGAAGALALIQSDRDSLVTAAGPGMLIAASLAPPAGVVGMGMAIGEWDLVKNGAFLLILQLIGINLSGSILFWLFGLKPEGIRYERGKAWKRNLSLSLTIAGLIGIFVWQFSSSPNLQRSSLSKRITEDVKKYLKKSPLVEPVEVNVRFTRPDIKGQNSVLIVSYLQNTSSLTESELKSILSKEISAKIKRSGYKITPLIDLSILEKSM